MALRDGLSMSVKTVCPECRNGIDRAADHRERRLEHVCTKSVGNLDRNGSEFREMWRMEMRAEHPAGGYCDWFTRTVPTAPPLNVAADSLF